MKAVLAKTENRPDFHRLEYFRNAAALVPDISDDDPGVSIMVCPDRNPEIHFSCGCRMYRKKKHCNHIGEISSLVSPTDCLAFDGRFRRSIWFHLATVFQEMYRLKPDAVSHREEETLVLMPADALRIEYLSKGRLPESSPISENRLLLERCGIAPEEKPFNRGEIIDMLRRATLTETEYQMIKKGVRTRRQSLEESFWFKLFYHCMRISDVESTAISGEMDMSDGLFSIRCRDMLGPMMTVSVPHAAVPALISQLAGRLDNQGRFTVHPHPLTSIVKVSADDQNRLVLKLHFLFSDGKGNTAAIDRSRVRQFQYGDLFYLPEQQLFASVSDPDHLIETFGGKLTRRIRPEKVPDILEKLGRDLFAPPNIIDESIQNITVFKDCSRIEVTPEAIDRDWCWLSVHYGFGEDVSVSLADIYQAKLAKKRFLPVSRGWIDVAAFDLDAFTGQPGNPVLAALAAGNRNLKLSRLDLFRLKAATDKPVMISGNTAGAQDLAALLELKSPAAFTQPAGLSSPLRDYQKYGVEWLTFLYENRFGGLLCDDMGLGKTHQVMALMVWLLEERKVDQPFLVVCPTTVISHWERKIQQHAPALKPVVYHGYNREFPSRAVPGRVMITSYGILLRDAGVLSEKIFALAAFDEAQSIKNADTLSYKAASAIRAEIKIGVTGTPVENRLTELKALMDLVLPGFLGEDDRFAFRYGADSSSSMPKRRRELRRLISPFTLRRMKTSVLSELPEKIEDIRYCTLTDIQVRLYREASGRTGGRIRKDLQSGKSRIDYIHIFALLMLLKQICNHPALVKDNRG